MGAIYLLMVDRDEAIQKFRLLPLATMACIDLDKISGPSFEAVRVLFPGEADFAGACVAAAELLDWFDAWCNDLGCKNAGLPAQSAVEGRLGSEL